MRTAQAPAFGQFRPGNLITAKACLIAHHEVANRDLDPHADLAGRDIGCEFRLGLRRRHYARTRRHDRGAQRNQARHRASVRRRHLADAGAHRQQELLPLAADQKAKSGPVPAPARRWSQPVRVAAQLRRQGVAGGERKDLLPVVAEHAPHLPRTCASASACSAGVTASRLLTARNTRRFRRRAERSTAISSSDSGLSKLVTRISASASGMKASVARVFSAIEDPRPGVSTK